MRNRSSRERLVVFVSFCVAMPSLPHFATIANNTCVPWKEMSLTRVVVICCSPSNHMKSILSEYQTLESAIAAQAESSPYMAADASPEQFDAAMDSLFPTTPSTSPSTSTSTTPAPIQIKPSPSPPEENSKLTVRLRVSSYLSSSLLPCFTLTSPRVCFARLNFSISPPSRTRRKATGTAACSTRRQTVSVRVHVLVMSHYS